MAADETSTWSSLPGIIIVEILSYLTLRDRLSATATCRRWRSSLWHPSLWKTFTFSLKIGSRNRSKHLADRCGRFVRSAIVELHSTDSLDVKQAERVLNVISSNRNIESLTLRPSSCHIEWPDRDGCRIQEQFLAAIIRTIATARKLKHFALGNSEDLSYESVPVLEHLAQHQRDNLLSLHVGSVKEDPEYYGRSDIQLHHFQPFTKLESLSIDYDYLTNAILECLAEKPLRKLVINVHGIDPGREKITDSSWQTLRQNCSAIQVTLNFIHSEVGIESLLDILRPNMPLAHFRAFFCSRLNTAAIDFIAKYHCNTMRSLHILDGIVNLNQPAGYFVATDEDPFVMLAWKCRNLEELTLIGYSVLDDNLVAITRLRGKQLSKLDVPLCCIASLVNDSNIGFAHGKVGKDFFVEISGNLGHDWRPIMNKELHASVLNVRADAETAYRHILLQDQNSDLE